MQISYKIGTSLWKYYIEVRAGRWVFPDYYGKRCPVCRRLKCTCKHAFYSRQAFTEDNKKHIPDLPIKRYRCKIKGVTISLLPVPLIPYHKYPVRTLSYIADWWRKLGGRVSETTANIFQEEEEVSIKLLDIEPAGVYGFIQLFQDALTKYRIWQKRAYSLTEFIVYCSGNDYCQAQSLALEYYESNGGYATNSQFLFGRASQFRRGP